jgi:hypothetical protein
MAATTTGQNDSFGAQPANKTVLEDLQPDAAAGLYPELQCWHALTAFQPGTLLDMALKSINKGTTRSVLGMEHSPMAMGRFQGGAQTTVITIESHAQIQ